MRSMWNRLAEPIYHLCFGPPQAVYDYEKIKEEVTKKDEGVGK